MTRISTNQSNNMLLAQMAANKSRVDKYSKEVSSGLKVFVPGDTNRAGEITRLNDEVERIDGYTKRIVTTQATLNFQDQIMEQASNVIMRAREIAEQMANESNSVEIRNIASKEVWGLRSQMVDLANSVYQGRFIYGGADNDDPPFDQDVITYTSFGSPESQIKYNFDNYDPPPVVASPPSRSVLVSDTQSIRISTAGDTLFSRAIAGIEKLGRALEGYRTDTVAPDYTAFTFPTDYSLQTSEIAESLDDLETARSGDIQTERASLGERLNLLEVTTSLHEFSKDSAKTQLSNIRDADTAESATGLSLAQTALQASYTVTSRMLNLSIMDYI
jgi:flagellar hook-associated protein 3 FlgL